MSILWLGVIWTPVQPRVRDCVYVFVFATPLLEERVDETGFPAKRVELPLQRCDVYRSHDVDEVQERMAQNLCPHELEITERGARLDARFHSARLGRISLMYVEYGAAVRVKPGETGFVAVQFHLAGDGKVECGNQQIYAYPKRGMVANADESLEMWLSRDTRLLLTRFELSALAAEAADLVGDYVPLRWFELGMDVVAGYPRDWLDLLISQVSSAGRLGALCGNRLAAPLFEEFLVANLLKAQRNNCSRYLAAATGRPTSSRLVCQAVEMIEAAPQEPLTVSSVARRLGTGALALDEAFRTCRGTTVLDFMRRTRLERARRELRDGDPAITTVEEICDHWGFVNVDRFTAGYGARFGESPFQSLQRAA